MEDIFKKYTEVVEQSLNDMLKDYNLAKAAGVLAYIILGPSSFPKL